MNKTDYGIFYGHLWNHSEVDYRLERLRVPYVVVLASIEPTYCNTFMTNRCKITEHTINSKVQETSDKITVYVTTQKS